MDARPIEYVLAALLAMCLIAAGVIAAVWLVGGC
jgi:hypothetical protein